MTTNPTPAPLSPEREAEIRQRLDRVNGDRVMTGSTWLASSVGPKSVFPPEQSHVVEGVLETKHSVIRSSVGVFGDKQHAEFTAHAPDDIAALLDELVRVRAERDELRKRVAELERAAVEGCAALANLADDHADPGTAALGALWLLRQATLGVDAPPDQTPDVLTDYGSRLLEKAADALEEADHLMAAADLRELAESRSATWGGGR